MWDVTKNLDSHIIGNMKYTLFLILTTYSERLLQYKQIRFWIKYVLEDDVYVLSNKHVIIVLLHWIILSLHLSLGCIYTPTWHKRPSFAFMTCLCHYSLGIHTPTLPTWQISLYWYCAYHFIIFINICTNIIHLWIS